MIWEYFWVGCNIIGRTVQKRHDSKLLDSQGKEIGKYCESINSVYSKRI